MKTETIKLNERIDLFDERYQEGAEHYEEDMKFLNDEVEALVRRQMVDGEKYTILIALQVVLGSGDTFVGRVIDFDGAINNTIFVGDYDTNVFLEEDGTLRIDYYYHGDLSRMEMYLLEESEVIDNPLSLEHYIFIKNSIKADEIFLEAFGITSEQYEIDK